MKIYNVYQSGKRLYIDEKENPDNKIACNKYESKQTTLRLISDGTLPPRLYWALRNPKLSNKYFILKLINNEDLIVGTDISATPGLWDMLLIGTDEDYIIEGTDIDQSKLTYVSDHFGRLFVRDNFLEELDFEEQCSPTFRVFYDEIMFQLGEKADAKDIPDKMSDLENDTNFISGVALKDDGEGNVNIIGTTFSGGETEEGGGGSGGNIEVDDKLDEESTNPVQNKVVAKEVNSLKEKDESLDKEVKALREHNTKLKETIEKLQIKQTTDKAPFHHITDSANMKVVDFGMEGKTEQETVAGNQLFDKNSIAIINELLQNDGTAFPNLYYVHTDFIEVSPTETYALKIFNSAYLFSGLWMYDENKTFVSKYSYATNIVISENVKYIMIGCTKSVYEVFSESDMNNVADSLMLIKGSAEPTIYEPYTGAQPSPNPDYPQEIVNAGVYNEETGRYEHKCCVGNKNIWNIEYASDYNNWVNLGWYACIPVRVPKGATIKVSYQQVLSTGLGLFVAVSTTGIQENIKWLYHSTSQNLIENSVSIVAETDYIYIHCNNANIKQTEGGTTQSFMQYIGNDLQIEISDTVTDLLPHASQPFTLTSDRPLTKWDKLVKRDGVWGWSVNSMNRQLIGTYSNNTITNGWRAFVSDTIPEGIYVYVLDMIDKLSGVDNILCTTYHNNDGKPAYSKYATLNKFSGISSGNRIFFCTSIQTLDEWKAYLDENPLDIWYQTTEEQSFHPLPDEEQELLNNLETYYGVTNLYNDQGCPMWLCYTCDSKLYVDQKLEQINNALLSLGANV